MRQTWRNAGIWAFAGLFGCISLLGPGWHCVWGHHFHGPAACHDHDHEQPADHHGHEHAGCHEHEAQSGLTVRGPIIRGLADEHDCPLCRFFAQAQWTLDCESPAIAPATIETFCPAERSAATVRVGLYQSRAPPVSFC